MTGAELKAVEGDLLREVLAAFTGHWDDPGHPLYGDDPDRTWPMGACDSTCDVLFEVEANGGFDWGRRYGLHVRQGGFYGRAAGDPKTSSGHVWLQADDGTIVDPTVGQFVDGPALRVIEAGDPLQACFSAGAVIAY